MKKIRNIRKDVVTVKGVFRANLARVHHDVTGNWGGYRTMIAHYVGKGQLEEMLMYVYVGPYYEVGHWPNDDPKTPSHWEVATALTKAMENGVSRRVLLFLIKLTEKLFTINPERITTSLENIAIYNKGEQ